MTVAAKRQSINDFVREQGGRIQYPGHSKAVDFPDADTEPAERPFGGNLYDQIERAIERAREYGTTVVRLWRERGEGWFAATSHEEHPGMSYLGQIDERTGEPIRCECTSVVVCHHLGAEIHQWRQRVGWYAEAAKVDAVIEEAMAKSRALRPTRREEMEEAW